MCSGGRERGVCEVCLVYIIYRIVWITITYKIYIMALKRRGATAVESGWGDVFPRAPIIVWFTWVGAAKRSALHSNPPLENLPATLEKFSTRFIALGIFLLTDGGSQ